MSSLGSGGSPQRELITTSSSYEQQVIVDLQCQLRQLAKQNRDSVTKALSDPEGVRASHPTALVNPARNATHTSQPVLSHLSHHLSHPAVTHSENVGQTSHNEAEPSSFITAHITSTQPASVPKLHDVSYPNLTQSQSNPVRYSGLFPGTMQVSVSDNFKQKELVNDGYQRALSIGGVDTMNTQQRKESVEPSISTSNRDFLEKQLEDAKAKVFHLDSKLKECNDICEQQKLHFRTAIVDLQTKLNDTIVGRNSVLELRRQEAESQERLINQLQVTFADVGATNQQQAQAFEDASKRVANLEVQLQSRNSTMSEVHTLTILHATKRGLTPKAYSNPMDYEHIGSELKEVLDFYEKEIEGMGKKIEKAERELSETQEQFAEKWKQSGEEQKQMLRRLSEEHEEQLSASTERALNARKQTLSLQSQLALTQEHMQQQLELKTSHVADVQSRLEELQNQTETTRNELQTKCDSLTSELQTALNHYQEADEEKHQLLEKICNLELELQAAKESTSKAEADVKSAKEENSKFCNLEKETNIKMNELKTKLDMKSNECEELSRLVEEAKEQSERHFDQKVLSMQEDHNQRMTSLTHDLTSQINDLTIKHNTLMAEYTQKDSEHQDLLQFREDLIGKLEEVQQELQRETDEKGKLALDLADKQHEMDVMQREKVQYLAVLEGKNIELSQVQTQKDQLHQQVNERDEECLRLKEQTSSMAQLAEVASKVSEDWDQEREHMKERLQELTKELQELKGQQEVMLKKLKIREKRLQNVEEDNKRLQEELQGTAKESETVVRSKEELEAELKQAKTKIDMLIIEQDKMKDDMMEKEQSYQKGISKYRSKIHTQHRDLTAAHDTIQATVVTDGKAVKVAESMQQQVTAKRSEIDTLQSDIHWLKECLDITRKEKSTLVGERDQYKAQLTEMSRNVTNLTEEVQRLTRQKIEQRSVIAKLDQSLKKAAMEHGECKAVIERQEQDLARLKLKHQLDIKELQRAKSYKDILTKVKTQLKTPIEHDTDIKTKAPNMVQTLSNRLEQSKKLNDIDKKPTGEVQPNDTSTRKSAGFKAETFTAAKPQTKQPNATLRRMMTDEDLRVLLLEMQKVVSGQPTLARETKSGQPTLASETKSGHPTTSREPKKTAKSAAVTTDSINTRYIPDTVSHSRESGYNTKSVDKQKGGMTVPLLTSSPVLEHHTPLLDNLSLLSSVPEFNPIGRVITPEPDFLQRPLSPVANLLSVSPKGTSDFLWTNNNTSHNNSSQSGPLRLTPFESQGRSRTPDVLSLDSVSTCSSTTDSSISLVSSSLRREDIDMQAQKEHLKRLQEKLQSLSKIGGHLQKENKDMATMIKQQSSQLKKVRQQEHSFQQLVKKGK
ncbi:coiled-coil domain-containing protein 158-like [Asterias amurensis]|uniref:coiled-coil domain-containing protein 158-like n=1 Tax=Asterias amurensis TaxID=7602 RepID=UPI003AB6A61B